MLDLRRTAAPLRAARLAALAAALMIMCLLAAASAAHAESGELAAFGPVGDGAGNYRYAGPVAVDPGTAGDAAHQNQIYLADYTDNDYLPRITKFDAAGNVLATVVVPSDNPGGAAATIIGMSVDTSMHRLYVLMGATGNPDRVNTNSTAAMDILVYSTQESGGRLVKPADVPSAILTDFRDPAGGWVDSPEAIAVDPSTHDIAIIGNQDDSVSDPVGVIQYVNSDGSLDTPLVGLGADVDPDGNAYHRLTGMAILPNGKVLVPVSDADNNLRIYSLPRGSRTATLVATDPQENSPQNKPTLIGGQGLGTPIAASPDGASVWVAEGDATLGSGRVRGFSVATGQQVIAYGGGTTSCNIPNRTSHIGIGVGLNDRVVASSGFLDEVSHPEDRTIHVFGPGGTGCPMPRGAFSVNGTDGDLTVTKGQAIRFDASTSDLRGGVAGEVDWDFDGSGTYGDVFNDANGLRTTHTFATVGRFAVGVKIHIQNGVTTEPVIHTVTVVAPKPTAAFTASTRTPAAGGTVTFDATNSIDPGQPSADAHRLKSYRWDFGDGSAPVTTTTPTTSHAFANSGTASLSRTVRLVVVSADDVSSDAFSQAVTVSGTPTQTQTQATTTPVTTPTTPTTPSRPSGPGTTITFPSPSLGSPSVDAKGTLSLSVRCPAGGNPCTGSIALTTKVTKKVRGRKKVTTVKLGTVSFSVDAGKSKTVKVKLSATGRSLLKKSKRLAASAAVKLTVSGQSKTTSKSLTLKAASAKKH